MLEADVLEIDLITKNTSTLKTIIEWLYIAWYNDDNQNKNPYEFVEEYFKLGTIEYELLDFWKNIPVLHENMTMLEIKDYIKSHTNLFDDDKIYNIHNILLKQNYNNALVSKFNIIFDFEINFINSSFGNPTTCSWWPTFFKGIPSLTM